MSSVRVGNHRETGCSGASTTGKAAGWSSTHRLRQPLAQRTRQFQAQQTASGRSLGRGTAWHALQGCGWHREPGDPGRVAGPQQTRAGWPGQWWGRWKVTVPAEETESPAHCGSWEPLKGGCGLSGLARWVAAEFQEQGCGSRGRTSGAGCPRAEASQTDVPEQMLTPGGTQRRGDRGTALSPVICVTHPQTNLPKNT